MNTSGNFYKVILIGNSNAGKTCIANRITNDTFSNDLNSTIGCNQFNLDIIYEDKKIKFTLWDTAGQEKYRSLIPSYTHNADIALLVFDLSHSDPFQQIEEWYKYLIQECNCNPFIILIGNKLDLGISLEKNNFREFCDRLVLDICPNKIKAHKIEYVEISAKTSDGVPHLMEIIGKDLFEIDKENSQHQKVQKKSIDSTDNHHQKKECC